VWHNRIIFLLALSFLGCGQVTGSSTSVRLAAVARADLSVRYVASGHVYSKTVRVASPDAGILVERPVQLHQSVKKGDLLFRLDDQEARRLLDSKESELASALAKEQEYAALLGIRTRQSELEVLQSQGKEVEAKLNLLESQRGALLEERQKMRESVRQAQARLEASQLELGRQKELFSQDVISQVELENSQRAYQLDQSSYRQALAEYNLLLKGTRSEELERLKVASNNARLDSEIARQKQQEESLQLLRLRSQQAEVQRLSSVVSNQRYLVARRRVVAPTDGVVSQLQYELGESVMHLQTVLSLVTDGPYWVEADVDEQDASYVKVGQAVRITLTSLPGKNFTGKVVEVSPSLEPRPQGPSDHKVMQIRVEFDQKVAGLRSGLEADVEGQVSLASQALSIPRAALQREKGQDFVWSVKEGRLNRIEVKLGSVSSEFVEIKEGLTPGDQVVIEGAEGLAPGAAVSVRK